jgi:hypothetical protein
MAVLTTPFASPLFGFHPRSIECCVSRPAPGRRFRPEQGKMPVSFVGSGQQLADPGIECQEFHLVSNRRSQQPGVGYLSMTKNTAGACDKHLIERKVERHEPMRGVRRVAQQQFRDLADADRTSCEYLLRDDPDECRLCQRGRGPTLPGVLAEPGEHSKVVLVRRPAECDQRIGVEQMGPWTTFVLRTPVFALGAARRTHVDSSSMACTCCAESGGESAGRSKIHTPATCLN